MNTKSWIITALAGVLLLAGLIYAARATVEHYITGRIAAREVILQKQLADQQAVIDRWKADAEAARVRGEKALADADKARAQVVKLTKDRAVLRTAVEGALKRQEAARVEATKVPDAQVRSAVRAGLSRLGILPASPGPGR